MDSEAITNLTGSEFVYDYKELPLQGSDDEITAYVQRTRDLFDPIARTFNDASNTE